MTSKLEKVTQDHFFQILLPLRMEAVFLESGWFVNLYATYSTAWSINTLLTIRPPNETNEGTT